jgi:cysteine synthase B
MGISSAVARRRRCEVSARSRTQVIVHIVADRGDRYLSTGVFPA